MNRLVIIGNGFDLAHGMRTSYQDFIKSYLFECFNMAYQSGQFENQHLLIVKNYRYNVQELSKELIENIVKEQGSGMNYRSLLSKHERSTYFDSNSSFLYAIKNDLIGKIIHSFTQKRWVDIENEYFKLLISLPTSYSTPVIELNSAFGFLKERLDEYLSKLDIPEVNNQISNLLLRDLNMYSTKRSTDFYISSRRVLNKVMLLNFNYTNLVNDYVNSLNSEKISHIQIHGCLSTNENPTIFGYGDEMTEEYKKIELLDNKEWLKFIKSFRYGFNSNYWNLMEFIESDEFEVYVLGHSCGLSDRVMLNSIFENEKCKTIRIFYHKRDNGTNDYLDIYQNIARQFSMHKRAEFRKKVFPLDLSEPLPQSPK